MTPETYQRVKQIFTDAIGRPDAEREKFVIRECGEESAIRDEVLSLLRHHDQRSLIETVAFEPFVTPSPFPIANDQDTTGDPTAKMPESAIGPIPIQSRQIENESVGRVEIGRDSELSRRFDESTLRLLRSRLIAAIYLTFVIGLTITAFGISTGTITLVAISIRAMVFAILGVVLFVLRSAQPLDEKKLHGVEIIVIAVPLLELMSMLVRGTEEAFSDGQPDTVLALRSIISTAVAIYIAIYGILIPATWQRTAAITVFAALLPTAVALAHRWFRDELGSIESIHYINPMLTLLMAMVATTGANIVQRVRWQAEAARLYGQYRLTEEIGRGGMGVVYRAEHQMLKRPAAIKVIRHEAATDERAIKRFEEEVQISATLTHWNTVEIYDYGRTDDGDFYYVMEYLQGDSLYDRLVNDRTLPLAPTLSIVMQTCDGLADAHQRGVIHRDIKPNNLFLAEIGGEIDVVKILDFGLATTMSSSADGAAKVICGTPRYMSPEQIRGEHLDGRSDLYAIACVAMECVTGSPPFDADSLPVLLSEQLFKKPRLESVEQIDTRFAAILERCLAKDRNDRYKTVTELRSACAALL